MRKIHLFSMFASLSAMLLLMVTMVACNDDDSEPAPQRKTTYNLMVKDVLGVSGTATITETTASTATIAITLTGALAGTHPAQLCMNTAIEGGAVVLDLNAVDATGKSSTVVNSMTYADLIAYDGYIRVLKSETEPNVILAQGDIGGNVITSTKTSYPMVVIEPFGVSGAALFEKRINGSTLLTITLSGTITGQVYPASINLGSIETVGGGPVVRALNNVDGATGKSFTNIRKLDSGIIITYDNWLVYDGYINVYQNQVALENVICHGNIGSN